MKNVIVGELTVSAARWLLCTYVSYRRSRNLDVPTLQPVTCRVSFVYYIRCVHRSAFYSLVFRGVLIVTLIIQEGVMIQSQLTSNSSLWMLGLCLKDTMKNGFFFG